MSNAENVSNDTQIENNNIIPETTGTNAEAGNTEPTATAPSETTVEASAPVAVAEEAAAPTTASAATLLPYRPNLTKLPKLQLLLNRKSSMKLSKKLKLPETTTQKSKLLLRIESVAV